MNIFKYINKQIKLHCNTVQYWRQLGSIIGNDCSINTSASLGSEPYLVKIGDHVRINAGVQIITHDGGVWVLRYIDNQYKNIDLIKCVEIGNNVHIGTNAVIMPGVIIGDNCIIGVGAIVTKNIPSNSIAVGVPAKVIETIDDYQIKHQFDFVLTKSMNNKEKKKFLISKYQK